MMINGETLKNSGETQLHCHFVHHKPHLKSPRIEPWDSSEKPGLSHLRYEELIKQLFTA